ncbi:response regulator transcription factor [Lysinibacillus yapensis]|uniref:response regulator transcription factor n=1 Tax=Ureibacillus yapensis TaxID=2304605 RepID=UPI001F1EEA72|nr:helix-turn-helix transcriptional regulator [Lysinibacillus yapensis]
MLKVNSWEHNLEKIKLIGDQDQKMKLLIESFLSAFSLEEALLFRYSPIDHLAEGILSATPSEIKSITFIRDDVTTIPAIFEAILSKSSQYYEGNYFHLNISRKYIISENQNSLLVVPITFNQVVMGYFLSSKLKAPFHPHLLVKANLFSKQVAELFLNHPIDIENNELKLSKREFEVMKCIAFGYSTKQISSLLEISETTIKQYIKSVMAKTNTANRTHAVAFLFQKGILN